VRVAGPPNALITKAGRIDLDAVGSHFARLTRLSIAR
jgi:hypothetical protein